MNNKRIVITGLGPLTSIGFGKQEVWKSIIEQKVNLSQEKAELGGELIEKFFIHKIKNFDINKFNIDKNILKDIEDWKNEKSPVDLYYAAAAATLALEDASLSGFENRNKIGLILTHENPGLDQFYWQIINEFFRASQNKNKQSPKDIFFNEFYNKFDRRGYELQTFMFLYHVARLLNIQGYSLFINNACASGLYALEAGADAIRNDKCKVIVVAAADCGSIFKHLWFKGAGVYSKDGQIRPFAKNCSGFVSGDCGAALVLEDLATARKRKAHIYAEYAGGSFSLDTWKVIIPNPISDSYKNIILDVLDRTNTNKQNIDLLVPHGVAMPVTDYYEAKAITGVFGKNSNKPLITAFKPYIGHCLGASALIESIILLLSMDNNVIVPTLNSDDLNPSLNIQLTRKFTSRKIQNALKIACGFAGYNGAAVFRKINL